MARKTKTPHEVLDIFVSAVVITDYKTRNLASYIEHLVTVMQMHYMNFEVIIVGSGISNKESFKIKEILPKLPCIRFIKLAREYNADTTLFAGLDAAIGDYVCTLDERIDPPDSLPELVKLNLMNNIVQGVSAVPVKGVVGSHIGRKLFYWYNRKFMDIQIPINATYFMAFSRKAVNEITGTNRDHRRIRHLVSTIGFDIALLRYVPTSNPQNDRSLKGGVLEAFETITGYSTHPLRVVSWIGVFASFLNLFYAAYVLIVNIADDHITQGWTTTSMQLSSMFFILFLSLAVVAEYMARILSEQRNDQKYVINDEYASTISIADYERKNITDS